MTRSPVRYYPVQRTNVHAPIDSLYYLFDSYWFLWCATHNPISIDKIDLAIRLHFDSQYPKSGNFPCKMFSGTSKNPKVKNTKIFPWYTSSSQEREHSLDILRGKCSTATPPFIMATEYRSTAFRCALSHCMNNLSKTKFLTWNSWIYGALECTIPSQFFHDLSRGC